MLSGFTTTIIWKVDCLAPSPGQSKMIKCKHLENSFIMLMRMSMGATIVENCIEVPHKIKNWITIWFSKPLLGIYPKELKLHSPGDISIPVFVAALFTITKTGKQPKCPLMDEWINIWYIHIMECCVCVFSVTQLCLTLSIPWTVAHEAPLTMGFPREE